jgi:hypothetical protein
MGVGEQLDLHGVEPNALPAAAGILHAHSPASIWTPVAKGDDQKPFI